MPKIRDLKLLHSISEASQKPDDRAKELPNVDDISAKTFLPQVESCLKESGLLQDKDQISSMKLEDYTFSATMADGNTKIIDTSKSSKAYVCTALIRPLTY